MHAVADMIFNGHHKKRRRNPLVRNISDRKDKMLIIQKEEIIEITAYRSRRLHYRIYFKIRTAVKKALGL